MFSVQWQGEGRSGGSDIIRVRVILQLRKTDINVTVHSPTHKNVIIQF